MKRQPDRCLACPNVTVFSDNLVGRDSHPGGRSLDSFRPADRGSRPECDSRPDLCRDNRHGTGRGSLTLRDNRASNAPPTVDRSGVPGLPTAEHRRGSIRYSEFEPCRSCFGQNRYVHRAPLPTVRLAQRPKASSCVLNVATSFSPPYSMNSRSSLPCLCPKNDTGERQ